MGIRGAPRGDWSGGCPTGAHRRDSWPCLFKRSVLIALALVIAGCAARAVEPYEPGPPAYALAPQIDGAFADLVTGISARHGVDVSGLTLLDANEDGLKWRLFLIDSARYSIDAQYYLWYGDSTGRLLIRRLVDAADRGVRVRLLVDDLNTMLQDAATVSQRDEVIGRLDSHPNIELRLFNPWKYSALAARVGESVTRMKQVNRRMHNKSLIVDNHAVIVGGRNVGDEYMGLNADFNFRDLDVLAVGPAALQASAVFDNYWNSEWVRPASLLGIHMTAEEIRSALHRLDGQIENDPALRGLDYAPADRLAELEQRLHLGRAEVISDRLSGAKVDHVMLGHVTSMMRAARRELLVENAYIIPSENGIDMLRELDARGVRTRILTNSLASHDVPAVNSHYRSWRKPIISSGAELYELRHDPALKADIADTKPVIAEFTGLHSKVMVVDRERAFIGSMNYDPRSAAINTEMGMIIESPGLANDLAETIGRDMLPSNSWRVTLDEDGKLAWTNDIDKLSRQPARNRWQRVQDWFFRIFPKELY